MSIRALSTTVLQFRPLRGTKVGLQSVMQGLARMARGRESSEGQRRTRADRRLARRVWSALDTVDQVESLQFYVRHGFVVVYGTVRTEEEHQLVGWLIRKVPGVCGVDVQIQVVDTPRLEGRRRIENGPAVPLD